MRIEEKPEKKSEVDNMILDGKEVKLKVLKELKEKLIKLDRNLGLVVIQVGDDPASNVYVRQKNKMAENLGYNFNHIKLDSNITEEELLSIINELNSDDLVDGILVQMPIPRTLNAKKIQNAIMPDKDVDGLTDINMGKLVHNRDALVPCTPMGIIDLLDYYNIQIEGKNVVVLGRSDLVGKPMATLMTNRNATVTLCHSKTNNLEFYTKNANILVVAVGIPKYIKEDMVKDGAVIIDVGINRMEDNSLCGDVDFDSVKDKVSYITPVPGGVGQMTVAELAVNTYKAHTLRKSK
jgi:methylenetetrahydrofolate dehydrogenase (NADP+) / methenyltetrahydrofolate cyclohydrolase